MALTSAQHILTSINILDPHAKMPDVKRHPANEFQAYAFKLATDLNDLQNVHIYMRLAKNVERSLMERAYSFVSDSTTDQKGRLFLWKLKLIRTELQKKRDATNFDYDFVATKMSKTRDKLQELISDRASMDYSEKHKDAFYQIYDDILNSNTISKREKPRVLILGYTTPRLVGEIELKGYKVQGIDLSKKLSAKLKDDLKSFNLKSKWIAKDFLKNSFEDNYFDVIFLNNYWSLVPRDSEITFLKALKKVLKNNGKLVINSKVSNSEKQEWRSLKYKGEDLECFVKESNLENIQEALRILFDDVLFLN